MTQQQQQHPIAPPPELFAEWLAKAKRLHPAESTGFIAGEVARLAYRTGADQELEACCEYLVRRAQWEPEDVDELRAARRPKPPSLKEQALALVEQHEDGWRPSPKDWDTLRRALEQLPDNN
jgi:proteasome lid subunit RPN8/RPN11